MRSLSSLVKIAVLTLSLTASAEERQNKHGMMEMHKKHMKCMKKNDMMGCQEMMMRDCKMNKDMCKQMMEDMEINKNMPIDRKKETKKKTN